jgi:hypothetical protein
VSDWHKKRRGINRKMRKFTISLEIFMITYLII